jgi:NAD(P)-dependent dehydrogenase (short-subunit alcohol dehydrogenase family)
LNITFDGKVAMVTGAASGIGLACAELLAASGAKVALVDVHAENLAKATKNVESKGTARGYRLDVADIPGIATTVTQIRKDLGEVDVLVCSAGVGFGCAAADIAEAEWNATFDINTKGLFFCNQAAATQSMIPRKAGSIVNIASIVGLIGQPPPFMCAHYHGSKAAVIGITRQEAVEWASYNIRVNAIAPAFVKTPFIASLIDDPELSAVALGLTPLGHFVTVDDVAAAVCFLASDAANMITGITLPVDGGWTAR